MFDEYKAIKGDYLVIYPQIPRALASRLLSFADWRVAGGRHGAPHALRPLLRRAPGSPAARGGCRPPPRFPSTRERESAGLWPLHCIRGPEGVVVSERTVAVTGAWSYSGRRVAARLLRAGYTVVSLTNRPVPAPDPHAGAVTLELMQEWADYALRAQPAPEADSALLSLRNSALQSTPLVVCWARTAIPAPPASDESLLVSAGRTDRPARPGRNLRSVAPAESAGAWVDPGPARPRQPADPALPWPWSPRRPGLARASEPGLPRLQSHAPLSRSRQSPRADDSPY